MRYRKKVVSSIREAGAKHVYGLIDWDCKNKSDEGIIVLAEGARYALESVLFDPLLILNLLFLFLKPKPEDFGLPEGTTFVSLGNIDYDKLQGAVDVIQRHVLDRERHASDEVKYVGGAKLLIDCDYLRMNSHELEEKIDSAYIKLRDISRNKVGELAKRIAERILYERPEHTPLCLLDTLRNIIEQ